MRNSKSLSDLLREALRSDKNQNCRKGFTLIEIIVVMAIVLIVSGTVILNFGKNDDRDVRQEKDRFTSFLREVQNKSLAAEKVPDETKRVCGFGVHMQGEVTIETYYIVANTLNEDCKSDLIGKTYDASHKLPEVFNFFDEKEVIISDETFPDIFFLSPNGAIYADGSTDFVSPIIININKREGSSDPITIKIDRSGRIF